MAPRPLITEIGLYGKRKAFQIGPHKSFRCRTPRRCENQQVVAADPTFVETLLNQLASAAEQLEDLAREVGKQPLDLSLDDLIAAAESRCRN